MKETKNIVNSNFTSRKAEIASQNQKFFWQATNLPSLRKLSWSYFVKIIRKLADQNHKVSAESFLFEATADKYLYFKLDESVVIYLFATFQEPNFSSYKWEGFKI